MSTLPVANHIDPAGTRRRIGTPPTGPGDDTARRTGKKRPFVDNW